MSCLWSQCSWRWGSHLAGDGWGRVLIITSGVVRVLVHVAVDEMPNLGALLHFNGWYVNIHFEGLY